ncbi:alkaline phosphatase family protein [Mycobacterium kansasii]|uniref:alkaline phosphatase family protein n=1 Tax=Mycobacterium kansasii TaxID=1768 RepID=UPI0028062353|nr:alkaline phosphatase family protein [Mycobacterium kansasii]
MGYHNRRDIPIHYLLADTFTVLRSLLLFGIGSDLSNRLYWLSAWIDPAGTNGGHWWRPPPPRRSGRSTGASCRRTSAMPASVGRCTATSH